MSREACLEHRFSAVGRSPQWARLQAIISEHKGLAHRDSDLTDVGWPIAEAGMGIVFDST